ncbi:MAG: hypothetical protein IKR30_05720 [Bacteroidales bacterium]|nr:hypothetical protein [Bacteroidales bacterium]
MATAESVRWFAAMMRNGQWKNASRILNGMGVGHYIPPSYRTLLFLHTDKVNALSLVNGGRIHARFLIDHGTRTLLEIPQKQMEDFMRVMEQPEASCAADYPFAKGDRVRVTAGALKGVEGEIVETPEGTHLLVRVSTLLCAKVRIPRAEVVPAE